MKNNAKESQFCSVAADVAKFPGRAARCLGAGAVGLAALFLIHSGFAAEFSRSDKSELTFTLNQQSTATRSVLASNGQDTGKLDFWLFKFGYGQNLNDYLNLNLSAGAGKTKLTVTKAGTSGKTSITTFATNLALDYNILKRRFTPFVTGSTGLLINNGSDPFGLSNGETEWIFAAGGGLRYDINDRWLLKAYYEVSSAKFHGFDGRQISLRGFALATGVKF
jgi:opacity protein-like surface antigen